MNAQQKTLVTLGAAGVVALGLGLYAYLGVMKPAQHEAVRKEAETKLFIIKETPEEPDSDAGTADRPVFTALTVEVGDSKTVMELQNGKWRITSPVSGLADRMAVDSLTHQLSEARFKATVDKTPKDEDLARYGLKPPHATVTARAYVPDAQGGGANDPARQRTLTFYTGVENTFDGSVYVRREGDPAVYSANGSLRYVVDKRTGDWRDRVVFPVKEPELLRIEVKARKNAYTLERTAIDQPWKVTQPVALRADAERISQMMMSFFTFQALHFPSPEQEPKVRQALEKPAMEVRFVPNVGDTVRVRITEVPDVGISHVFALSEGGGREPVLAEMDPATLTLLDVGPLELKDKKALSFENDLVQQIVIQSSGGSPIKLVKAGDTGKWEVTQPMQGKAKEFKVASLLGALGKLKAEAIVESRPKSWSKYGIGDTSRGVSLRDAAGTELAKLWVGHEVKGNPKRLWARGSSEDVLELDKANTNAVLPTLADVLDGLAAPDDKKPGAPASHLQQ